MDLSQFDGLAQRFEQGRQVDISHPVTGEKTDLWVRIVSYQSERCKAAQKRMADKALRDAKRNPRKVATAQEIEDRTLDLVVAVVVDWNAERDGKPLECTPENVRAVVSDPNLWFIAKQIDMEADDEQSFLSS